MIPGVASGLGTYGRHNCPMRRAAGDPLAIDFMRNPVFGTLCDIVAEGELMVLTGAGLSSGLINSLGRKLPNWSNLLRGIRLVMERRGCLEATSDRALEIAKTLSHALTGRNLVQAASMLFDSNPIVFMESLRNELTLAPADRQPEWEAKRRMMRGIVRLKPRGIVTMNVDTMHEQVLRDIGVDFVCADPLGDPDGAEQVLLGVLRRAPKFFLLKAHGTLKYDYDPASSRPPIAFTRLQYRELMTRNPVYKAFMSQLLTQFNVMAVGFGMTDLDFDLLRDDVLFSYGGGIKRHVVFEKTITEEEMRTVPSKNMSALNAMELRDTAGVETLYLDDYPLYQTAIDAAAETPGPKISSLIAECLHEEREIRSEAHHRLRSLGEQGKEIAVRSIERRMLGGLGSLRESEKEFNELVYTLGCIEPRDRETRQLIKRTLFTVCTRCHEKAPIAYALSVLHPYVVPEDLPTLYEIGDRLERDDLFGMDPSSDPDDRLPVFLENLILRVRASDLSHPESRKEHRSFLNILANP